MFVQIREKFKGRSSKPAILEPEMFRTNAAALGAAELPAWP
jgi:hypothetical protein